MLELVRDHSPRAVVCDGYGPPASLVPKLEDAGVTVTTYSTSEYAQACGRFVDIVREKGLRHLGSPEIAGAVRVAQTRPLGDAWAWSRKLSDGNISPLVSATLAVDAAVVGVGSSVYDTRDMIVLMRLWPFKDVERRSGLENPDSELFDSLIGAPTISGERVDVTGRLYIADVFAAVSHHLARRSPPFL